MKKKTSKTPNKAKKGNGYVCGVCGLAVTVDNICGCLDPCDIICCGKTMKPRK
jgi:hypothetical protein